MISVNWISGVIYVPKADMTQVQPPPNEVRQLNLDVFRLTLRDLEDDPDGRPWPQTHRHNTQVTLGGVTLARVIEILAPYTVTFEPGQYAVNLVGANSNVADRANVNQVSIRSANSAGLISGTGGLTKDDVSNAVWVESPIGAQVPVDTDMAAFAASAAAEAASAAAEAASAAAVQATFARKARTNRDKLSEGSTDNYTLYDDDGVTPLRTHSMTDKNGGPIILPVGAPAERGPGH